MLLSIIDEKERSLHCYLIHAEKSPVATNRIGLFCR